MKSKHSGNNLRYYCKYPGCSKHYADLSSVGRHEIDKHGRLAKKKGGKIA